MAILERTLTGDFDQVLHKLHNAILDGSMSASFENGNDYMMGDTHCAVRVYERYSYTGDNRVALCLMLTGLGDQLRLTAITAGGSQAMFFKINTWGEEAFLDTLAQAVDKL
ncbi:hypothetical protein H9X86_08180 [Pseudoflavonifractor capillosus]|uniref:DUF6054 family protein n=1 Tax=Pseudoflavonifractor capillosus TaxID=106588 RepID=UPI00195BF54D|nr:DUF6054 family protein [Pseudoflavonifractor capillosus]MBM6897340.1 hypothetical protein [Pseudoflavonifractor capillosus]